MVIVGMTIYNADASSSVKRLVFWDADTFTHRNDKNQLLISQNNRIVAEFNTWDYVTEVEPEEA